MDYLTIEEVCYKVKILGLTCKYYSDIQEFRINYKITDSRWNEDTAYYTTYRDDAVETAKVMAKARKP